MQNTKSNTLSFDASAIFLTLNREIFIKFSCFYSSAILYKFSVRFQFLSCSNLLRLYSGKSLRRMLLESFATERPCDLSHFFLLQFPNRQLRKSTGHVGTLGELIYIPHVVAHHKI